MKKQSILVLLLAAAFAASLPTTAAAAVVTLDLTRDLDFEFSIPSGSHLTTDRGTTVLLTNFRETGDTREYWFSADGQGSGNGVLNFAQLFDEGTPGSDFGRLGAFGPPFAIGTTSFNFGRPVEILSVDFLILTPGDTLGETRALINNTSTKIYDPLVDGEVLAPKVVTYNFPSLSVVQRLSFGIGTKSYYSLRSITFNDPSVAPVPEPGSLAVFCGLGLAGFAFVRRRRRAA